MEPQVLLGRVRTREGKELVLYERAGVYAIRVDGLELMSSMVHASEEAMARRAAELLKGLRAPRVLVGGFGMGFTLRAALAALPATASVVVVEVLPEVLEWGRTLLGELSHHALGDPRVTAVVGDVYELLSSRGPAFDAILLDVDNGPVALTLASNGRLYAAAGLVAIRRRLARSGVLVVWSAAPDESFERALKRAGFKVATETVRARAGKGSHHTLFVARR